MNEFIISLAIFTWLYFGAWGIWKMWKFLGVPPGPILWIVMLSMSLLGLLCGPIFMQAVYEIIIERLEEIEDEND